MCESAGELSCFYRKPFRDVTLKSTVSSLGTDFQDGTNLNPLTSGIRFIQGRYIRDNRFNFSLKPAMTTFTRLISLIGSTMDLKVWRPTGFANFMIRQTENQDKYNRTKLSAPITSFHYYMAMMPRYDSWNPTSTQRDKRTRHFLIARCIRARVIPHQAGTTLLYI